MLLVMTRPFWCGVKTARVGAEVDAMGNVETVIGGYGEQRQHTIGSQEFDRGGGDGGAMSVGDWGGLVVNSMSFTLSGGRCNWRVMVMVGIQQAGCTRLPPFVTAAIGGGGIRKYWGYGPERSLVLFHCVAKKQKQDIHLQSLQ